MSIINNINNVYNSNTKRVYGKLSFEVGQQISAKVLKNSDSDKEVILKLLDGWQFEAILEEPLECTPQGLIRFQIEGFVDGKLKLSLIKGDETQKKFDEESVENVLLDQNINVDKDDFELLEKMIKHNMPITKENISKIKNVVDFIRKMNNDDGYADNFINKYLHSKNILPSTTEGQKAINSLKNFFNELKNINEDELLILFENGIELTEDNIKSFNNLFKKDSTLYKEINEFKQNLDMDKTTNMLENKDVISEQDGDMILEKNKGIISKQDKDTILEQSKGIISEQNNDIKTNVNKNDLKNISNIYEKMESSLKIKEGSNNITDIVKGFLNFDNDEGIELAKRLISSKPKELNIVINSLVEDGVDQEVINSLLENITFVDEGENKDLEVNKNIIEKNIDTSLNTDNEKDIMPKNVLNKQELKETSVQIKEQITSKTEEIKTILKSLIEQKGELKGEAYNNIMSGLKQNSNDFKIFNTVSNQYYYMDLPVNINSDNYQCKLIIKDERKNGKKIDSREAKIAASIRTINMGTVDAYIRVNEHNMNIEIKCEDNCTKYLELGKEKMLKSLSNLGYNVYVSVKVKEKELNLINCREFFNDNTLGNINILV